MCLLNRKEATRDKEEDMAKYKNFYTNSTVNAWNLLQAEVVSDETVNIF